MNVEMSDFGGLFILLEVERSVKLVFMCTCRSRSTKGEITNDLVISHVWQLAPKLDCTLLHELNQSTVNCDSARCPKEV